MHKRKYSLRLKAIVNGTIPQSIHDAMHMCGWDAFYIYEFIEKEVFAIEGRHLTNAMHSDGEGRAVLEKSSIPGDEETFNNGKGW